MTRWSVPRARLSAELSWNWSEPGWGRKSAEGSLAGGGNRRSGGEGAKRPDRSGANSRPQPGGPEPISAPSQAETSSSSTERNKRAEGTEQRVTGTGRSEANAQGTKVLLRVSLFSAHWARGFPRSFVCGPTRLSAENLMRTRSLVLIFCWNVLV